MVVKCNSFPKSEVIEAYFQLTYVLAILSGFALTNQHTASLIVIALVCFVLSDLLDHEVYMRS